MLRFLVLISLFVPNSVRADTPQYSFTDGLPPVIRAEPMVVNVLAEPGACFVHSLAAPQPCAQVVLPDGTVQSSFIDGFAVSDISGGPARLYVSRLTYDWSQNTLSHPVVPGFALIERLN